MTNLSPAVEPPTPKRRSAKPSGDVVSASALARHLDVSRAYVAKLEADGVIRREPGGGYSLDVCRMRYINHLRRERQVSAKSKAQDEFTQAKTALVQLRVQERAGLLMRHAEHVEIVDAIAGVCFASTSAVLPRGLAVAIW